MNKIYILTSTLIALLLWGCSDDLLPGNSAEGGEDTPGVEAFLSLSVSDFSVISDGTRADYEPADPEPSSTPEEVSDFEKQIKDIWVFQYKVSDNQILRREYQTIGSEDDLSKLKLTLSENVESYICVVANTNDASWGNGTDVNTYAGLKNKTLPSPEPIIPSASNTKYIPMEGMVKATVRGGSLIVVPVNRMYAKLRICFGGLADGMKPYSIEVKNIPYFCRVNTLGDGLQEKDSVCYRTTYNATTWISRTFDASKVGEENKEYILYIPENLQGVHQPENGKKTPNKDVKQDLEINLTTKYNYFEPVPGKEVGQQDYQVQLEENRDYTVYPGGNTIDNFNIKRNHVYRVKTNVYYEEKFTPSSNCLVVVPGNTIAFEPYNRTEQGGGYNINTYLDPSVAAKTIKRVAIIWQTKDAIGDNSAGDLVWFVPHANTTDDKPENTHSIHSRIIVRTNKEGNALVAAYDSETGGNILWSWHIWITGNDPGNIGKAIVYNTYGWDPVNGINTDQNQREPGYAVMPCNLGALANSPTEPLNDKTPENSWYSQNYRTYGTLYQWGRKDPFPPAKRRQKLVALYSYNDNNNGNDGTAGYGSNIEVYNNSHSKISIKTTGLVTTTANSPVFNTILATNSALGTTSQSGISYSIKHPTMHIAGAENSNYGTNTSYINRGDWLPVADEKLWGGIPISQLNPNTDHLVIVKDESSIWKNYGDKKTIFDPCPAGWRVPPGDLWMGFTNTGKNQSGGTLTENYNYLWTTSNVAPKKFYTKEYYNNNNGYWFCLNGWQSDNLNDYSFFPTQGARLASGQPLHGGCCGNYHNATCDSPWGLTDKTGKKIDRVNILHAHTYENQFTISPFENSLAYSTKAVAGPVRCVRDTK